METENNNQGGTKKGGIKVVIAISVVVILALVGVIIWLVMSKDKSEEQEKRNVVTQGNVEEIAEEMQNAEPVEPGYYTATMNNVWHFKTGSDPSEDAYVENKTENTNDVYFDLFLASDETNAIYKSPVIPIGGKLENIALDTPLEAGTYDCVLVYHLVDEEQNTLSTLRVSVTLEIEG